MASNVAAMLMLALLLSIVTMMARSIIVSSGVMERASTAALDRAEDRAKTNLSVTSATAAGSNVQVKLKNTGATSISDFSKMDFIITYVSTAGGGTTVTKRLTYTTGVLAADQWKTTSISPDNLEPNTWNRSETLTLDALLSGTLQSGTSSTVAIATPEGVDFSAYSSYATP